MNPFTPSPPSPSSSSTPSSRRAWAAALVFAATCAYRFTLLDLTNDDLLFFTIGRQIAVFGEWPVRDLFEEGDPLHNLISAALQVLTGHALVGEVVFDILMLATAAALTTIATARLLGSAPAGVVIGMLTVLAAPRLYDYPKAVIPALALLLCTRYLDRPNRSTVAVLGGACGIAFLLRHDLGVYVAAASAAALAVSAWSDRDRLLSHSIAFGLTTAVLVVPYLLFVQAHTGLMSYITSSRQFTGRELSRSDDPPPRFHVDLVQPLWRSGVGRPIKVRWAAATLPEQRVAAEQRYALSDGRVDEGRTWSYVLHDTSTANLVAIVRDPVIEDTADIDRLLARGPTPPVPSRLRRMLDADVALAPGILTRQNAVAWLYFVYRLLPLVSAIVAALVVVFAARSGMSAGVALATLLPPLVFCVVSAPLLLRGNLYENSRLADFTTPALLLAASLLAVSRRMQMSRRVRVLLRSGGLVVATLTALAICSYGQIGKRGKAIAILLDEGRAQEEWTRLWDGIVARPPRLDWVPRESGVRGAVEYLLQCTRSADRVLIYGFYPEVLYFSGRAAASDRVVMQRGFGVSAIDERRTLRSLERHPPTVAIVEATDGSGSRAHRTLDSLHPISETYLVEHYSRVATTAFGGSTGTAFDVWIANGDRMTGQGLFGLPCR